MVDREVVLLRLERLKGYIKFLKLVRKLGLKRFKDDPFVHGAAERNLHLSIECLLDIGNHVISDRKLRKPETYGEIFDVLAEEGIISKTLLRRLDGMAAFRNLLVHDYVRLDLDHVYGITGKKLKDIEALAKIYSRLL
ncbi:MAG: DUF86 domain-containing protein [Pseudomonadota bacterium]